MISIIEFPEKLNIIISSYLRKKKNNILGFDIGIIYKLMQCNSTFYRFFHFKINNYFNKHYKFSNNITINNICKYGQIGFLNKYINNFIDFNKAIPYKNNEFNNYYPIYIASENGNLNIIKKICENNKSIKLNVRGPFNTTPLIVATRKGYIEVVKYLTNNLTNDEILSMDRNNRSALHWACIIGYFEIVKYLRYHYNQYQDADLYNKTPRMYAEQYGHYDICDLLDKPL